jgi:Tfp pilus assembly protein PilF
MGLHAGEKDDVKRLVEEGMVMHDNNDYQGAIRKYKDALKIDKHSGLANYELAYTYYTIGEYKKALKYSKRVFKNGNEHKAEAYIISGSSMDLLGKPGKAIQVFEDAIKAFPTNYLLYYNLALSAYGINDLQKAEEAVINAIYTNMSHASSHLLLSYIMNRKGNRVKAILPAYFFLLLEPDTKRSAEVYEFLIAKLNEGVEKVGDSTVHVNIPFLKHTTDDFGPAELMISMVATASKLNKGNPDSFMEEFSGINNSIFNMLGELKQDKMGFYWDKYVDVFYDLSLSDNMLAYSYYVSQTQKGIKAREWLSAHPEEVERFSQWLYLKLDL